jgi:hypothetical protein
MTIVNNSKVQTLENSSLIDQSVYLEGTASNFFHPIIDATHSVFHIPTYPRPDLLTTYLTDAKSSIGVWVKEIIFQGKLW